MGAGAVPLEVESRTGAAEETGPHTWAVEEEPQHRRSQQCSTCHPSPRQKHLTS